MRSIVRYAMERVKWELAGKPLRSAERVHDLFHEVCKPCENFGGDRCNVCSCFLSDHLENPSFNKLAWATTHCPLPEPKWREELEADVDLEEARKLAEKEVAENEFSPQVKVSVRSREAPPRKVKVSVRPRQEPPPGGKTIVSRPRDGQSSCCYEPGTEPKADVTELPVEGAPGSGS